MKKSHWKKIRVDPRSQIPLAHQLSRQIKIILANNQVIQDSKLPSLRDMGDFLGISFHTVRAAYQQLEREGLLSTRKGAGSVVKAPVPSLIRRQLEDVPNYSIGVIIPTFTEFFSPLIQGVQEAAVGDPSLFFICDAQEDPRRVDHYLDRLIAHGVDGILIVSREVEDFKKIQNIKANAAAFPPIVFADIPGYPPPVIRFDLAGGTQAALSHLLDHGHQRIGLIFPPMRWLNVAECFRGVDLAFAKNKIELEHDLITEVKDYGMESGYQAAEKLLRLDKPPTAIFAAGDLLATGALKKAKEMGLRVPEDLALMGFNDPVFFDLVDPPMSTIKVPAHEMGVEAYKLLRNAIDRKTGIPNEIMLKTELVIRRSCGCEFQF